MMDRALVRLTAVAAAAAFFIVAALPSRGLAYMAAVDALSSAREADMRTVERVIEAEAVAARLRALGLSADDVRGRLAALSDAELHAFASDLDSLSPGAGFLSVVAAILIMAIVVLLVLKVTGHKIVIR
ncbi:MAG TPA: hypothetical protein ENJ37_07025 [Deltaproteobacteria bacterium]|nr:hypothetical protein [Deltaproteobacteria bacterium]